ncbi:hypothetical protein [Corynebacterium pseudotuberculosis]|uniref:hypothetical protein n=1 Tax=Corynebacterium pseudotuberculosis TaxID=1719 RepID=UPI000A89F591|nr:hypothetical protein [Corynebacterium pseudotuberculosis]WFP66810.1 hypothetical protein P8128_08615 [Corynebacterium pseudotuberculosis]
MNRRIIGPLAGLVVAATTTIVNPAIWPISAALAILATINIRTALKRKDDSR